MNTETFDEMMENMAIDKAIEEAEAEYAADGVLIDAKEALASLRIKHAL